MPTATKSRGRRKKNERRSDCPMACALDVIGDKWTLLVLRDLQLGCKRYGDFLESPERYPTNILADRLKRLEDHGFIERKLYSKRPPRAEYYLTEKGESLESVMNTLSDWGMAAFENCTPYERPVAEEPAQEAAPAPAPEVVETVEEKVPVSAPEPVTVEEELEPVAETPARFEPVVVEADEPKSSEPEITPEEIEVAEEEAPAPKPFEPVVISMDSEPEDSEAEPEPAQADADIDDDSQEQMSLWG